MLLNHTSGIIDYLNVYGSDKKAMRKLGKKGKVYTFEELMDLAIQHGDMNFEPGSEFKYCNTGYVILGDIISKVTGEDWRMYIEQNIFKVAGLQATFFGSLITDSVEQRKMEGYFKGRKASMPPTLAGSAGEIVSCIEDLEKFITSWSEGLFFEKEETLSLHKKQGFQLMYPQKTQKIQYGYGIMNIDGYYGHGGQTFGFQTFLGYHIADDRMYVIGSNDAIRIPVMAVFLMYSQVMLN